MELAEEKRKKRLEAWKKRKADGYKLGSAAAKSSSLISPPVEKKPKVRVSLAFSTTITKKKKKKKTTSTATTTTGEESTSTNIKTELKNLLMEGQDEDDDHDNTLDYRARDENIEALVSHLKTTKNATVAQNNKTKQPNSNSSTSASSSSSSSNKSTSKGSRWDVKRTDETPPSKDGSTREETTTDALDEFMEKIDAGEMGNVVTQQVGNPKDGGGVVGDYAYTNVNPLPLSDFGQKVSGGVITAEELEKLSHSHSYHTDLEKQTNGEQQQEQEVSTSESNGKAAMEPSPTGVNKVMKDETMSDEQETINAGNVGYDNSVVVEEEDEEEARRLLIEALKKTPSPLDAMSTSTIEGGSISEASHAHIPNHHQHHQLASEVKDEKQRRNEKIRQLEAEAREARRSAEQSTDVGRIFNDADGGVMEEAERQYTVLTAAPDALEVLAELNKKKELKAVDHSTIDYLKINKNLYRVPRSLSGLSSSEVALRRSRIRVRVRGVGCPAPISRFEECGLSERMLQCLASQKISEPYPIQAQCLPAIMAGRDVIGIAKTGSGKTLAYLLPMLRHVLDQPDLGPQESGPIGLVLAPARELATQIHSVCKSFVRRLGIKSTAVYGGAGVAEQIGDLKRGVHIAVATPGRMIDILTMQSGKLLSLRRVSYVVMDEADRMFDMGFAPQISAILSAVRPDRQTVLFSATFPRAVETLARKSLKYPVEVLVGGRSVATDNVVQYAEVVEDPDKFLRLLQLLGQQPTTSSNDNDEDEEESPYKTIIFVDTQTRADSIYQQLLSTGYVGLSLHGGKEQEDRDSTIADFKADDGPKLLVATSVAGRGLDVPSCGCVINYSAPNHLEDYVHRVGRTGRAEKKGVAYTMVNSAEEAQYAPLVVRAMTEANQAHNVTKELQELATTYNARVKKGEARWAGSGFKGRGYTYDSSELNDSQKLARLEKRQALIDAGLLDPEEDGDNSNSAAAGANDPYGNADGTMDDDRVDGISNVEGGIASSAAAINANLLGTNNNNNSMGGGSGGGKTHAFHTAVDLSSKLSANVLALPGMQEAILRKAGVEDSSAGGGTGVGGGSTSTNPNHFVEEIEINDYPREARWKVTQKETTSRLQDEFQTAVTLKGEYVGPQQQQQSKSSNSISATGSADYAAPPQRRLYLHLEATSERILKNCVLEVRRLLNEETLRVGARVGGGGSSHRYNVL